jgi:hypothetical protein
MEQQHDENGPHKGPPHVKGQGPQREGSPARRRLRRAMLRALAAGGGLTAVGLGAPLAPGALGADAASAAGGEDTPPPATGTTHGTTPPAQQGASSESASTTSTAQTSSSEETSSASTTSTSTSTTPQPTQTASGGSASGAGSAGPSSGGSAENGASGSGSSGSASAGAGAASPSPSTAAPTVVVQAPQRAKPKPPARRGSKAGGKHGGQGGNAEEAGGAEAGQGSGANKGSGAKGSGKGGNSPAEVPPGTPNGVAAAPQSLVGTGETLASLLGQSQVSAQALSFYRIPLFLLPIYQAAAAQYGVPWQILAAINEVETDYGSDQSVSSAGAVGWMQFMPETWVQYGVDALNAGYADPYNPVDAIFAAARYLHAAGASHSLRRAILAYNHSEAYAESVLLRAKLISSYPQSVIAILTGLTEGSLPVAGAHVASYLSISKGLNIGSEAKTLAAASATAGAVPLQGLSAASRSLSTAPISSLGSGDAPTPLLAGDAAASEQAGEEAPATEQAGEGTPATEQAGEGTPATKGARGKAGKAGTAGKADADETLRFIDLAGPAGAPVTAVENGRIVRLGHSHRLGEYLDLQDIYGDVFTYAGLGSIAPRYRLPAPHSSSAKTANAAGHEGAAGHEIKPPLPIADVRRPPLTLQVKAPVERTTALSAATAKTEATDAAAADAQASTEEGPPPPGMGRKQLYANPGNPVARVAATRRASAAQSGGHSGRWLPLRLGSVVSQGTILGHLSGTRTTNARLGASPAAASSHMRFAIRPAGDSTTIDPRPIIANWRQLGAALHPKGAKGTDQLLGATVSQVFLMSQGELERSVLSDPGISLSGCARQDVAAGSIDGRVLAVLTFLSRSGLKPTVAGLRCQPKSSGAHGLAAAEHRTGAAVDISAINGIPIAGHQGNGSITDATIRALLTLKGRFVPRQIVSLMYYPGTANTLARANRWGNIHISFRSLAATTASANESVFTHKAHSAGPGQTAPSPLVSAGAVPSSASPLALTGDLSAAQWNRLIGRIGALPMPVVASKPTSSAIRDPQATAGNRDLGSGSLGAGSLSAGSLGSGSLLAGSGEEAAGGEEE